MNGAIMGDSQEMGESKKVNVLRADQYNLCTPNIKLYLGKASKSLLFCQSDQPPWPDRICLYKTFGLCELQVSQDTLEFNKTTQHVRTSLGLVWYIRTNRFFQRFQ